ncbi:MAG: class I SAM-dependent methyltransferase [Pikeienuella sp.]
MGVKLRRLRMGLQTVLNLKKQGFFIPYRYAETVESPGPYPMHEMRFKASEPTFRAVLADIEACAEQLESLKGPAPAPRWQQDWFPRADGAAAFAIVARRKPARIVEVGSGHSTRFMAAAAGAETQITCIDPEPRAKFGDLPVNWLRGVLDETHLPLFQTLEAGDVAFFDSSHLLVPGCDVDIIFNRILPILQPGVLVHIHDILLPDPYPARWEWRGYAEQNGLGGWLLAGGLQPLFSSHYAVTRMKAAETGVLSRLPMPRDAIETSLWCIKA